MLAIAYNPTTTKPEEQATCERCGNLLDNLGVDVESGGDTQVWCEDCASEDAVKCEYCDTLTDSGNTQRVDGSNWCEDCAGNYATTCERCGDVTSDDNAVSVYVDDRPESWCETCVDRHAFQCSDCGNTHSRDERTSTHSGENVCNDCYMEYYFTCESCQNVFHNDDYGQEGMCQNCYDESEIPDCIQEYGNKDACDFPKLGQGPHYLGVELEVVSSDIQEDAPECISLLGEDFVVLKEDGSLDDGGFEIVTGPASLKMQRERWEPFFRSRPSSLRSWNTSCCGMHVHASKAPLSQLAIGKMLQFINDPNNKFFIEKVAGRNENTFTHLDSSKKITSVKKADGRRRLALNLQPKNTIEFRIFKGTLKRESFFKNLEFVDSLIRFVKNASIQGLYVNAYVEYVHSHRKTYPFLSRWLKAHWN